MAEVQNYRDLFLQAAPVRVLPPRLIEIGDVNGLPEYLDGIDQDIVLLGSEVQSIMNNSGDLVIRASATTVTNTSSVTLTAVRKNGLTGAVTWSLFAGSAILDASGDSCTISGADVTSVSITVQAQIGGRVAYAAITKLGALSQQSSVNLASQVTGQLAMGNVTGYGALALLNSVNLNSQTTGALNGQTQVTNLGTLAYANAIAANQIGAGQLAAGVVYAGAVYADQVSGGSFSGKTFSGGTFTGSVFKTATIFERLEVGSAVEGFGITNITFYKTDGSVGNVFSSRGVLIRIPTTGISGVFSSMRIEYGSSYHGLIFLESGSKGSVPVKFENPGTVMPAPTNGGVFMHSTHGLCISDGTRWLKTAWTVIL